MTRWRTLAAVAVFLLALDASLHSMFAAEMENPRQRISINDDWRFQRGDPNGVDSATLRYDVRPDAANSRDDKPADSKPQVANQTTAPAKPVLKAWILPTANRFISDPAHRFTRPTAEPNINVPCLLSGFNDSTWQQINLPHDWAIDGPFNTKASGVGGGMGRLPSPGIGWYRKKLIIPATDADKYIFLDVDGAMSYSTVWLNGRLVGGWPYGYSSWRVDLTPYVAWGAENQLAIRLDNPPDSSRWYPGGGIYRNVWLTKVSPIHVGQWGTFVTTPQVSTESATIDLAVTLDNDTSADATVGVSTEIFVLDEKGGKVGSSVATIQAVEAVVAAGASSTVRGSVAIANPRLWGPPPQQKPNRYVAITTVSQQGKPLDLYETRFGIRSVTYDPDKGLLINGQRITIQGVNQHHDLGALGSAFNERAAERQLELLQEMGCNAIRMSHNPPAPELLELADRMGFLVMDEIFDCWYRMKSPLDFHLIFPEWHEPDLRALIRRDRNYPSVIVWSVGNEVGEQYTQADGAAVATHLCDIVHEEDLTRPATASMNFAKPDMPFPAALDLIGVNYQGEGIRDTPELAGGRGIHTSPQYDAFHQKFPGKLIVSSETASTLSTRGTYLFPVRKDISAPVREGAGGDSQHGYASAYDLYAVDFGSSPDKVFSALDHHPFVAGEFVWTGWDYLGEPTPYYSARSSYSGIIDLAGFKKDRFYLYQSRWRPDFPMAHILPHWTWPERRGEVTPVHVFTSGDEAELFLNGRTLGRKKKAQYEYRLRWDDVVYEPGELKAVAYKNGKEWASDVMKTADAAAKLEASPDRNEIRADGLDLSFVTVRITDNNGLMAPRARNLITFKIEGPGEIVATDNGDPTSLVAFPSHEREALSGLCLVIVRGKPGQPGTINLRAESAELVGASVSLQSAAAE